MRKSPWTTDVLVKIQAMFAAGRPEDVGRINNGLLAGVLAELIDRRHPENAEQRHNPIGFVYIKEAADLSRAQIATERVIAALSEFHAALKDELGVDDGAERMADFLFNRLMGAAEEIRAKLALSASETDSAIPQTATAPGKVQRERLPMARRDRSGG